MPARKSKGSEKETQAVPLWKSRRTDETRRIEKVFSKEYPTTEAYRFNSASIRIRIVDQRFEGIDTIEREDMVWPMLDLLPKKTRADVSWLLLLAPSEREGFNRHTLVNHEFEYPPPSQY